MRCDAILKKARHVFMWCIRGTFLFFWILLGLLSVDLACFVFSPATTHAISLQLSGEIGFEHAVEVKMRCATPDASIFPRTVRTRCYVDGILVKTLWWPTSKIYGESASLPSLVGEGVFVRLPPELTVDGNYNFRVESRLNRQVFFPLGKPLQVIIVELPVDTTAD